MTVSLDAWRARGRWYTHRGQKIFYVDETTGSGPTLVLIHGFPTASWDFTPIWPRLAQRFGRIVACDMIGFGFSAKPKRYVYDLVDQADLHEGLLKELGVDRAHVLAHDYGVSVAQELLARHLERTPPRPEWLSVALLNGGLFPETHRLRPAQTALLSRFGWFVARQSNEAKFSAGMRQIFGPNTKPTPEEMHAFWCLFSESGGHRQAHRLIRYILDRRKHRERWVGALQKTPVPLRLINGPEDPVSGAHMAARYGELVPNPDIVSLPEIGHYPQVEAPDAVADAFIQFVDRVENGSRG